MPNSTKKKKQTHSKETRKKLSEFANTPKEKARRRKEALKNPYFNGEKNGELHTRDKWTEEHREKVRQRMIKYNKSKAGREMASRRSKKTMSNEATKQRWIDGQIAWYLEHPEARIEHAEKHFQPHNERRRREAEQRKSVKLWREQYKKGERPIVKPIPNQEQEYYQELDDFFGEAL